MNYTDTIKAISDAVLNNVKKAIDKAKFDRTFDAVVVEIKSGDKCVIEYQGGKYACSYSTIVRVGDYVKVCAPRNDWNMLYVVKNKTISTPQTKSSSGGVYYDEEKKVGVLTWYTDDGMRILEVGESGLTYRKVSGGVSTVIWSK